jgi:N-acetylgalactosamine-N,N'-diacetylbacillosaminyl-diphospho-undecaprenol 4-alpha-N-acetylgalactosaminyltransferase
LVENQNFEKLTQAINLMINDTDLYQQCQQNAVESIHSFSLDKIGKQWLNLMNITPN